MDACSVCKGIVTGKKDLNPVSPMGACGGGRKWLIIIGSAGLTLHRWFDVIRSVCLVRQLAAIRQKDVTNVGLHALNLVNLKAFLEDSAIGTSTWVIYPKVTSVS